MKTLFVFLCYCCCFASIAQSQVHPGLDSTFGKKGILIETVRDFNSFDDMKLLPDGRILAVGNFIARYLPDGRNDSSFGKAGIVWLADYATPFTIHGSVIQLQADGKIIVAGDTWVWLGTSNRKGGFVMRLNSNGSLDSSFGQNRPV